MVFLFSPFFKGLGVSFSLICTIGLQNSFVLKQGILKNHIFPIALFCALMDTFLITLGVNGLGSFLAKDLWLQKIFHWVGILFLIAFGTHAFFSFFKKKSLKIEEKKELLALRKVMITLLTVTILNPHVYLYSFVLMASIAAHLTFSEKIFFTIGSSLASFIWFFGLGFGAGLLRRFFENSNSWKLLDFIIGCTMYVVGLSLVYRGL